jgi:biotin carboxyl carrier protein
MKDQNTLHISSGMGLEYMIDQNDLSELRILKQEGNALVIQFKEKVMRAELIRIDHVQKSYTLQVDGRHLEFKLETELDMLVRKMGMERSGSLKVDQIVSPMPGLVLDVLVSEGDHVSEGTPVLILEAMKMENVIKAPADVVIDKILVKKGNSVDKKSVLITFV